MGSSLHMHRPSGLGHHRVGLVVGSVPPTRRPVHPGGRTSPSHASVRSSPGWGHRCGARDETIARVRSSLRSFHLMKYPDTRHRPSGSFAGVTVSTAVCFFSKLVSNWMMTYTP